MQRPPVRRNPRIWHNPSPFTISQSQNNEEFTGHFWQSRRNNRPLPPAQPNPQSSRNPHAISESRYNPTQDRDCDPAHTQSVPKEHISTLPRPNHIADPISRARCNGGTSGLNSQSTIHLQSCCNHKIQEQSENGCAGEYRTRRAPGSHVWHGSRYSHHTAPLKGGRPHSHGVTA